MSQSTNKTKPHLLSANMSMSQTIFTPVDTALPPIVTGRPLKDLFTDVFVGSQNPKYKAQIRARTQAGTPSSGTRYVVKPAIVSGARDYYTANPNTYPPNQKGDIHRKGFMSGSAYVPSLANLPSLPLTGADINRADNLAIQKLYAQIKGIQSSVNSGEDVGEMGKTLRMLRSPMKSLIRLTNDVVDGHLRAFSYNKAKHIAKALGDVTLEYNFGIRPIINTVTKGIVGLQNRDYMVDTYPFRASGKDRVVVQADDTDIPGIFTCRVRTLKSVTCFVRYHGVWALGADIDRRSVQDVMGWNFRDTLTTVYNLIPYSWLVDYVSNLGTIVDSLSVPWNGVRWCMKTVRKEASNQGFYTNFHPPSSTLGYYPVSADFFQPGSCTLSGTAFARSIQTILPVPYPQLDLDLTIGQKTNVLALLASRVPIIGSRLSKAVKRHPTLPNEYSVLARRGSMYKIPYPFHSHR